MANSQQLVRQMLVSVEAQPPAYDVIWKTLDKHVGHGPQAVPRINDVLMYIDEQLINEAGPAMSKLWHIVTDYLERTQESLAAA